MTKDLFFAERTLWRHDVSVWADLDWSRWLIGLEFTSMRNVNEYARFNEVRINTLPLRVGVTAYRRTR
jgi:hypothetical protein